MLKINRRLILLLILVLTMGTLVGCKKQAPEGISQDFYDDMIEVLDKLKKTKGELNTDNGEDIIKKYKDSKIWLNSNEKDILDAMSDLHFWVWRYHTDNVEKDEDSKLKNKLIILDNIKTLSSLMDLDINEKKLLK